MGSACFERGLNVSVQSPGSYKRMHIRSGCGWWCNLPGPQGQASIMPEANSRSQKICIVGDRYGMNCG